MALISFILGTHPALSIAELKAVLGDGVKFVAVGKEAVIVDGDVGDLAALQKRLGGVVKIGLVDEIVDRRSWSVDRNTESITQLVTDVLGTARTRAYFGISVYEAGGEVAEVQKMRRQVKVMGPAIKRALQEHYERVRWAVSREPVLSSVAVVKNKLLPPEGVEVQILGVRSQESGVRVGCYLGHTVTVQPFEEYGARDFGRPVRDARSGIIPPKLAQMMVNLACPASGGGGSNSGGTILDPFCGSGTILQEALLLGHHVIGSDISAKAVADAQINLEWLTESCQLSAVSCQKRVEQHDVLNLIEWLKDGEVNAIVTEPYLGPQQASKLQVQKAVAELSALYLKAFEQFAKILKPGHKVVMVWPVFTSGRERVFLSIDQQVQRLGFTLLTKRGELVYGREGQRVQREVLILRRS